MSNSWNPSQSNSGGGFIYFNTNKPASNDNTSNAPLDTNEFLSFDSFSSNNGSYQGNSFSPSNYSSPRNFNRNSPMGRSPRNYYSPIKAQSGGGKNWRRNLGLTSTLIEPNHPNNYNQQQNYHQHKNYSHHKKNFGQDSSGSNNKFFDASCLKDPWLELEQKLSQEKEQDLAKQELEIPDPECKEGQEENGSESCSGSDGDSEEGESSFS